MVMMAVAGCTGSEDDGEWPCRSTSSEGWAATLDYDDNHNLIKRVQTGGFVPHTLVAAYKGTTMTLWDYQAENPRYSSRTRQELDSRGRVVRREYEALGDQTGKSYVETFTYDGDRRTGSQRTTAEAILTSTYDYSTPNLVIVRECANTSCGTRSYQPSLEKPLALEVDWDTDGDLDYRNEYRYDDNGYVLLDDLNVYGNTPYTWRREVTRRPYGAPEAETISGDNPSTIAYEFCSENAP
jgi:hypothetical protein